MWTQLELSLTFSTVRRVLYTAISYGLITMKNETRKQILENAQEDVDLYFYAKDGSGIGEYTSNTVMYVHNLSDLRELEEKDQELEKQRARIAELEKALATSFEFLSMSQTADYWFYENHKHLIKEQGE